MDATYRVLWIEDQPDNVEEIVNSFSKTLSRTGLEVDIRWQNIFDQPSVMSLVQELKVYCPYDLIVADYDLGNSKEDGATLLAKLRRFVHTTMVFYSATGITDLRATLSKKGVDGVFCLARNGSFVDQLCSIAQSNSRRIFHPNYMRGIVVGAVSEFDQIFTDLICVLAGIPGALTPEQITAKVGEGRESSIKIEQSKLRKITSKDLLSNVSEANLYIKINILEELLSNQTLMSMFSGHLIEQSLEATQEFMNDLNKPRIEFAHAKTVLSNGVPVFKDRKENVWGPVEMQNLLVRINESRNIFNKTLNMISAVSE
ncbi:response regulator [Pseudomonas syringae group genomosp. 3]|uniref:response regulator n=1 Tax=Pseudomonas syringae group genomosp. 3 TaxID=251701 RepID=UPI00070A4E80|nr:response regulator [Pseudomonas syringae group genomosp. 3]